MTFAILCDARVAEHDPHRVEQIHRNSDPTEAWNIDRLQPKYTGELVDHQGERNGFSRMIEMFEAHSEAR